MANAWHVWQLVDSAFPSGGFAHSGGLEAAVQYGIVRDRDSLESFLRPAMHQVDAGVGQIARRAWRDPAQFAVFDGECELFLNNQVANRASRAQGQAFLASSAKAFAVESLVELSRHIREERCPGHLAPIFGVVARSMEIAEIEAVELFRFMAVRALLSSAVRLGIIGPMQGQQIQAAFRVGDEFTLPNNEPTSNRNNFGSSFSFARYSGRGRGEGSSVITQAPRNPDKTLTLPSPGVPGEGKKCRQSTDSPGVPGEGVRDSAAHWQSTPVADDDATTVAPILDLLQATHDRLYSRLFQS